MFAVGNQEGVIVRDFWSTIGLADRQFGQPSDGVEDSNNLSRRFESQSVCSGNLNQPGKQLFFERLCFFVCAQNFLFVFFEFGRDVALRVFQSLFADEVRGNFVAMCIGDFEVCLLYTSPSPRDRG